MIVIAPMVYVYTQQNNKKWQQQTKKREQLFTRSSIEQTFTKPSQRLATTHHKLPNQPKAKTMAPGERVVRWSVDHRPLSDCLYYYFANQDMVDVTVVCKDGELKAHRLVLCAGSRYFQETLLDIKLNNNMCFIHENVTKRTMLLLMEFFYRSVVPIESKDLKPFLDAAAQFAVRDIVVSGDSKSGSPSRGQSGSPSRGQSGSPSRGVPMSIARALSTSPSRDASVSPSKSKSSYSSAREMPVSPSMSKSSLSPGSNMSVSSSKGRSSLSPGREMSVSPSKGRSSLSPGREMSVSPSKGMSSLSPASELATSTTRVILSPSKGFFLSSYNSVSNRAGASVSPSRKLPATPPRGKSVSPGKKDKDNKDPKSKK